MTVTITAQKFISVQIIAAFGPHHQWSSRITGSSRWHLNPNPITPSQWSGWVQGWHGAPIAEIVLGLTANPAQGFRFEN